MENRYQDRNVYFKEQSKTTAQHVIPFIQQYKTIDRTTRLLEIGCGEGGNLPPFLELGCTTVGVDIQEKQVENSMEYLREYVEKGLYKGIAQDIYLLNNGKGDSIGQFDIIVMRDVIEHIHDQNKFMGHLKKFLKPDGKVFFGFPPWYMPFGGHQQTANGKASKLPYIHLLPNFMYFGILRWSGVTENYIDALREVKETGISIERFRRIVRNNGYKTDIEQLWLINPNYQTKFGMQPRKQWWFFKVFPFVRNFFTTCNYSIISLK
jgi:SAM-dependent methyltransferase